MKRLTADEWAAVKAARDGTAKKFDIHQYANNTGRAQVLEAGTIMGMEDDVLQPIGEWDVVKLRTKDM